MSKGKEQFLVMKPYLRFVQDLIRILDKEFSAKGDRLAPPTLCAM